MSAVHLVMDSASVSSPGGERLQVELSNALDRTCPPGAGATVLRRPDQASIGGFSKIDEQDIGTDIRGSLAKWRWIHRGLPAWLERTGATVAFAAAGMAAPRVLRRWGVVATNNNLALFLPAAELGHLGLATRFRFLVSRRFVIRTFRRADAIVLHSHHALETLERYTGAIEPKTTVVHTGVPTGTRLDGNPAALPHPYDGKPYFLYLSAIRWYKNHLALIEAYRQLSHEVDDLPELLLAGICQDDKYLREIEAAISAAGLEDRVRYLGMLPEEDLPAWLHHATINVFSSLTETNSVVIAEILGTHGVLAASAIPPVVEVAAEAAEFFDPRDPRDISRVLAGLWADPARRRELRKMAESRAAAFSWDACGEAIWRAAEAAAGSRRSRTF